MTIPMASNFLMVRMILNPLFHLLLVFYAIFRVSQQFDEGKIHGGPGQQYGYILALIHA